MDGKRDDKNQRADIRHALRQDQPIKAIEERAHKHGRDQEEPLTGEGHDHRGDSLAGGLQEHIRHYDRRKRRESGALPPQGESSDPDDFSIISPEYSDDLRSENKPQYGDCQAIDQA